MKITSDVSYADLIQTVLSILAFFAFPAIASELWKAYRFNFKALLRAVDPDPMGNTDTWQIEFRNRAISKVRSASFLIIPNGKGKNIVFAIVQSIEDGGLLVSKAELQNGAFVLEVERFGPRRSLLVALRMTHTGTVLVHDAGNSTRSTEEDRDGAYQLSISHLRLAAIVLYLAVGTAVIIARLFWIGYTKS